MNSRARTALQACRRPTADLLARMELAVESADDQAVRWRTLAALYISGGLLATASIPLGTRAGQSRWTVQIFAFVAILSGVALWRWARSVPVSLVSPAVTFGVVLITVATIVSGQANGGLSFFYVWVAVEVFYFFNVRVAALHTASVAVGYAVALVVLHGGANQWVLGLGSVATAGWLVATLRARIDRLSAQARSDPLTGLANRRGFDLTLDAALEAAHREHHRLSLVVIDLDRFKAINDRHGHLTGDEVLRRFADVSAAATALPVARLGGDEFAIIAVGHDQPAASALALRLRADLRDDGELVRHGVTMSAGIATFPAHGESARALWQAAESALHHAKERGRDQVVGFGPRVAHLNASARENRTAASGQMAAVILLSETLDLRDVSTSAHSQTVARYAALIADELGLAPELQQRIRVAGIVHDLGKIGVPDHVLFKPGPLTDEEWVQMRRHPEIGARILEAAGQDDLAEWVLAHHERPDGCGYPFGLSGPAIPLAARILSVADAYEAMTSDRPYRAAMVGPAAIAELRRQRDAQFDAEVVDAFCRVLALDWALAA